MPDDHAHILPCQILRHIKSAACIAAVIGHDGAKLLAVDAASGIHNGNGCFSTHLHLFSKHGILSCHWTGNANENLGTSGRGHKQSGDKGGNDAQMRLQK